jgi:hypothetical protein
VKAKISESIRKYIILYAFLSPFAEFIRVEGYFCFSAIQLGINSCYTFEGDAEWLREKYMNLSCLELLQL